MRSCQVRGGDHASSVPCVTITWRCILAWLGVLCMAWTPIALIVYPLLSEQKGRAPGRYVIMAAFRLYLVSLALSRLSNVACVLAVEQMRVVHPHSKAPSLR